MQKRLRHLEGLLKDVMTSQTPTTPEDAPVTGENGNSANFEAYPEGQTQIPKQKLHPALPLPATTIDASAPASSGQLVQGTKETTYVGATHWAAILDDVT